MDLGLTDQEIAAEEDSFIETQVSSPSSSPSPLFFFFLSFLNRFVFFCLWLATWYSL